MASRSKTPIKDACDKLTEAYKSLKLETGKRKDDSLCAIWKNRVDLGICFLEDFREDFGVYQKGTGSLDARTANEIPEILEIMLERLEKIHKSVQGSHTFISEYCKQREDLDIRALEKVTLISRQFRATQSLYVGICPIEYTVNKGLLGRRYTAFLDQLDEDFLASLDMMPETPPVGGRFRSFWPFGRDSGSL
ncbi:hypothetical protein ASPCAL04607 [Aspergillus calidoustus]|uniref:Uncharacterized protein n=1 Tax=Aspergillus calidoustus TaxID=454130 RepID=A0A0U5FXS6_ASPCI|nr:hypothetical protein ASPCAL04607 [Aspergillus calidoustus]